MHWKQSTLADSYKNQPEWTASSASCPPPPVQANQPIIIPSYHRPRYYTGISVIGQWWWGQANMGVFQLCTLSLSRGGRVGHSGVGRVSTVVLAV